MLKQFVLALLTVLGWQVGAAQILEVDTAAGSYQACRHRSPVTFRYSGDWLLQRLRSGICAGNRRYRRPLFPVSDWPSAPVRPAGRREHQTTVSMPVAIWTGQKTV